MEFQEACEEARKKALSFKEPLIVHHYDSVTGDSELIVAGRKLRGKEIISRLFDGEAERFGMHTRKDGKEIVKPKGLSVVSLGKDGKIKFSRVRSLIRHKTKKQIYSVKSGVWGVKVTSDHSLISLFRDEIQAVKPSEANFVAAPKTYPDSGHTPSIDLLKENLIARHKQPKSGNRTQYYIPNKKYRAILESVLQIDENLMCFFGLWIADGCFMHRKGSEGIRISCYEDPDARKTVKKVFSIFGATPVVTDSGITGVVCNKTLYNLMNYLDFFDGSRRKRVPGWVFGTGKKLIAAFLRGYFSGDGTVSKGDVNATTYSFLLARDIVSLLLFFGIRARVRRDRSGYKISINSITQKKIFLDKIGFLQKEKNSKVVAAHSRYSNYPEYIPISKEFLIEIKSHLPKKLRDQTIRMIKTNKCPTRAFLTKALKTLPKRLKIKLKQILAFEIYWEPFVLSELSKESQYVYDVETEDGNFICENIVLKNTDGIASGAIVVSAFMKEGKKFRRECIKKLDDDAIERYGKEKEIIFVDLGGGNQRVNELKDVLIIDHHQTSGVEKHQINPLLYGIDGTDELSSSGTAYFVFRTNIDLGIVGAVGDMQWPLKGANRKILEEGIRTGEVKLEEDLRFYGRYSRPLVQFLAYSDDPYIPGVSYREDKAFRLLDDLGIPLKKEGERVYADLDGDEKKKLVSAIADVLVDRGYIGKAEEMMGESYVFPFRPRNETYEANEFSTVLNACGRWGHSETGIDVCLGREDGYEKARSFLQLHRKMLKGGMEFAAGSVQDFGGFYFLDGRGAISENIIGTVCGMVLRASWSKPIVGIALGEKDTIKVSARSGRKLVEEGLNLGAILKNAVSEIQGVGGGHKIAAGASIPKEKINEFLILFSEYKEKLRPSS